jgi:hypothetical protein
MIDPVNNLLLLRRTVVSVLPTSHSMLDWDSKDSSRSRHTVAVLHLTIAITLRRRRLRLSTCNASPVVKVVQCRHSTPGFAGRGMQLLVASCDPSLLALTGATQCRSLSECTIDMIKLYKAQPSMAAHSARSQPHCQLRLVGKQKDASGLLLPVLNIAWH